MHLFTYWAMACRPIPDFENNNFVKVCSFCKISEKYQGLGFGNLIEVLAITIQGVFKKKSKDLTKT
jgi:hypothetical protein